VKVGEEVEIVGFRPTLKKVVTGVEMFRKLLDEGTAGDNIGVLLRGTEKDDVERGQVLAKPGSINAAHEVKAQVYVLTKEEGGRHTPFFNGYRPQFLPADDGRDGVDVSGGGVEMTHARRQHGHHGGADHAGGDREGSSSRSARAAGRSAPGR